MGRIEESAATFIRGRERETDNTMDKPLLPEHSVLVGEI